jgi:hypothetical protein
VSERFLRKILLASQSIKNPITRKTTLHQKNKVHPKKLPGPKRKSHHQLIVTSSGNSVDDKKNSCNEQTRFFFGRQNVNYERTMNIS